MASKETQKQVPAIIEVSKRRYVAKRLPAVQPVLEYNNRRYKAVNLREWKRTGKGSLRYELLADD